jgi:hypothetical protein
MPHPISISVPMDIESAVKFSEASKNPKIENSGVN